MAYNCLSLVLFAANRAQRWLCTWIWRNVVSGWVGGWGGGGVGGTLSTAPRRAYHTALSANSLYKKLQIWLGEWCERGVPGGGEGDPD